MGFFCKLLEKNEVYLRKAEAVPAGVPPAMDTGYAGKLGSSVNRKPQDLWEKPAESLRIFAISCWGSSMLKLSTPPSMNVNTVYICLF